MIRFILIGILVVIVVSMLVRRKRSPPLLEEIKPIEPAEPRGVLPGTNEREGDGVSR